MKDDPAVPKFIKPGDNPELDRIIAELKAEPPPVGRGADLFGRPYRRPGAAAEGKPAEAKPAEAKPAEAKPAEAKAAEAKPVTDAAVTGEDRRRGRWIALAAIAIVGPIVAIVLGWMRTRGPSVVLAPVNMTAVERTAPAAPVMSVPVTVPATSATASASASAAEVPSAAPVQRPSTNKKSPQPQAADAGAARPALPSDFLE